MSIIDNRVPSATGTTPKGAEPVRHGLITPPPPVLARIEQDRAQFAPEVYARWEEALLNDWTIGYTFDGLGLEVIYRRTPAGPVVLAVGTEEVIALQKSTPLAEQLEFQTFLGY